MFVKIIVSIKKLWGENKRLNVKGAKLNKRDSLFFSSPYIQDFTILKRLGLENYNN